MSTMDTGYTEDCEVSASLDNLSLYFPDEMKGVSDAVRSGQGIVRVPMFDASPLEALQDLSQPRCLSSSGGRNSSESSNREYNGNSSPFSGRNSPRRSSVSARSLAIRKSRTASMSSVNSRRSTSVSPSRALSLKHSIRNRSNSYAAVGGCSI
jgi:hypothetical protein